MIFLKYPDLRKNGTENVKSFTRKIKNCSLSQLMVGSNIFGRGLGIKKAKLILKHYPSVLVSDVTDEEK